MLQLIQTIRDLIPQNSLLIREPLANLLLLLPTALITIIYMLKLALLSISVDLPRKKILIWGLVLGAIFYIFRLILPMPFHILPDTIVFCLFIWRLARITIVHAFIATLFTESVVIVGSIFIAEPIILLSAHNKQNILQSSVGFIIGSVVEISILLIIIGAFKKWRLSLVKPTNPSEHPPVKIDRGHQ